MSGFGLKSFKNVTETYRFLEFSYLYLWHAGSHSKEMAEGGDKVK